MLCQEFRARGSPAGRVVALDEREEPWQRPAAAGARRLVFVQLRQGGRIRPCFRNRCANSTLSAAVDGTVENSQKQQLRAGCSVSILAAPGPVDGAR
jgi:hypothetical protein